MRILDQRSRLAATTVTLCLTVAACGGGSPAASPTDAEPTSTATRTVDEICAAAAGTSLTYYSPGDPPDEAVINERFAEAYPEIEVTHIQQFPGQQISTVLTEAQAGREPEVGIVNMNITQMSTLIDNGVIADLPYTAMGFPENIVFESGGLEVVRNFRQFGGLLYNSDTTDPADLPDTWDELSAAADLRGKFMAEQEGVNLGSIRQVWSQEEFEAFITDLVANLDPVIVDGTSAQVQKILTGEFVTGDAGVSGEINQQARTGAPVALKFLDVVISFDGYTAIVDGYANQDAAICYLNWAVSPEGTEALFDVTTKANDDSPRDGAPEGAVIASIDSAEDIVLLNEGATFYAEALQGQPVEE